MSMMINSYRFGKSRLVNWSPYYDLVTGQAPKGAWGTRKLVSAYNGPLLRVRDTTTNTEQDVGFDSEGFLNTFTVSGNAVVVTLYDQSGNANHLTQSDTTKQPLVVRAPDSFSGKVAIRFDGSNDFLHDAVTGTSKVYMVGSPIIGIEASGRNGGAAYAALANIPHAPGSNNAPYYRWGLSRNNLGSGLDYRLSGASSANMTLTPELNNGFSTGLLFLCVQIDRLMDGSTSFGGPRAVGDTVTYPNATGLRLGANGAGGDASNAEFQAIVILDDNTSTEATIRTWHDGINNLNITLDNPLVMDLPLTAGVSVDNSDYGHLARLYGDASLAGGYLTPGTGGAVIVQPSGLNHVSEDFTFETEVLFSAMTLNRHIAGRRISDAGAYGWHIGTHDTNSGELMVVVNASNSPYNYIVTGAHGSSAGLTTGNWYTVRVTLSDTTWRIYVDGVLRAERMSGLPVYNSHPFIIGSNSARNRPHPGNIRNVKMWKGVALVP